MIQQSETFGAGNAVADPGDVGMLEPGRHEHLCVIGDDPRGQGRMGVLAADAKAGQGGNEIQLTGNLVTARHWKLIRA